MKRQHELSDQSKHISFAESVVGTSPTFTPLRKPHYSAIQKKCFDCFRKNCYEELRLYLTSCEEKGVSMKDFFLHKGQAILDWAIISARSIEPLTFICENIPKETIQLILRQNDSYILKGFLLAESGMDKSHWTKPNDLELRLKKIIILSFMDPDALQLCIHKNFIHISEEFKLNIERTLYQDKEKQKLVMT